jgi:hypothetical protein
VRPLRPLLLPLLAPALALPLLTGCTSSGSAAARPAAFTPPDTKAFTGACAVVADDVVALGRSASDLRGQPSPSVAERDTLKGAQDRVDAVAETADAVRRPALQALVVAAGLVRIQADTGHLEPDTTEDLRKAYAAAVTACTSAPATPGAPATSASPTAG